MADLKRGDLFAERYLLLETLGEGGMGIVYKANDTVLRKIVAIKVVSKQLSDEAAMRFQSEAKATAKLSNANIVQVFDFGVTADKSPYMVLEYIEGQTLSQILKSGEEKSTRWWLEVFDQIRTALAHAHHRKILHRDLKPSNVIACEDEAGHVQIKLVDFGVAKLYAEDQSMTATNAIVGSPLYMSPEQAKKLQLDERSDVYSFGCLMYECLSGKPPFRGEHAMETIMMHANQEPKPLPATVPDWLQAIVMKCLRKDPAARYRSASSISFEGPREAHIEPSGKQRKSNRNLKRATNIAIALVLAMLGAGYLTWTRLQEADQARVLEDPDIDRVPNTTLALETSPKVQAIVGDNTGLQLDKYRPAHIKGVDITDEDLSKCDEFGKITDVDIRYSPNFFGKGFEYLKKIPVEEISITDCPLKDEYFPKLKELKHLRGLRIHGAMLSPKSYECLANSNLTLLQLSKCNIDSTTLASVSKLTKLRKLCLKNGGPISSESIRLLREIPHSSWLELKNMKLTDDNVRALNGFELKSLNLQDNPALTDSGASSLAALKGLDSLNLWGCLGITRPARASLSGKLRLYYDPKTETFYDLRRKKEK